MARLTRLETQERTRAKVLAAARDEFAERGFRDAKIDAIAERADLTRGAVYSNFPGKQALYFAVLADLAENTPVAPHATPGRTAHDATGALALAWVTRRSGLSRDLLAEIMADDSTRLPFTQLMKLNAVLLGLSLEHLRPPGQPPGAPPARLVRVAETILTTLHGASQLDAAAPGFVEPYDVVTACESLSGIALNDYWPPPPVVPRLRPIDAPWSPPGAVDLVTAAPARLTGVITVLGLRRVAAVEEAVRASAAEVTVVMVTGQPAEFAPLARLVVAELSGCLRQAFPREAWPRVQVVCDGTGAVAAAAGVTSVSDTTEAAIRVDAGRVVARAEGPGAGHAVAGVTQRS
jgi:AcrR family transcriptional regulator